MYVALTGEGTIVSPFVLHFLSILFYFYICFE